MNFPCHKCGSTWMASISGKCGDLFSLELTDQFRRHEGSVPAGMNIGGGDYVSLSFCLQCGQMTGQWPVSRDLPFMVELNSCPDCGESTNDDGECGYCENCRTPLCKHVGSGPNFMKTCPEEY